MEGQTPHFASASGEAGLDVAEYPAGSFAEPRKMALAVQAELGARGEGATYLYSGRPAYIADVTFEMSDAPYRGYLIAVVGREKDVALLGYASKKSYDAYRDEVLSALDSYAFDRRELRYPGPVSQFSSFPPAVKGKPMTFWVGGKRYRGVVDVREIDAAQSVIDRETRILAENTKVNREAWQRFYRVIYRDSYHRLDPFLPAVLDGLSLAGKNDYERAALLLQWMQGFLYARTGTFTDLSNPLLTFLTQSGDCDSRTLLYSLLLEHLGVHSVLMVSAVYSHSMVGVLVAGKGARYEYRGKRYLVAELTAPVALGLIDRAMADPRGWIGVDFSPLSPEAPASPSGMNGNTAAAAGR